MEPRDVEQTVARLLGPAEAEVGCDACFEQLDRYVELELDGADALGKTAQVATYTIIRELIEQSVRRGPPTRIDVSLTRTDEGGVIATVVDDAEPERRRRTFETVEQRVQQLHGELEVSPVPGSGTEIRVTLPSYTTQR